MFADRGPVSGSANGMTRGRVLVVEDDPQNARLLTRLLINDGFFVEVVGDGRAALSAVAAHPPDVILLDWMLPHLSGIDVCRHLKLDPTTRLIPIVLLTGLEAREVTQLPGGGELIHHAVSQRRVPVI